MFPTSDRIDHLYLLEWKIEPEGDMIQVRRYQGHLNDHDSVYHNNIATPALSRAHRRAQAKEIFGDSLRDQSFYRKGTSEIEIMGNTARKSLFTTTPTSRGQVIVRLDGACQGPTGGC